MMTGRFYGAWDFEGYLHGKPWSTSVHQFLLFQRFHLSPFGLLSFGRENEVHTPLPCNSNTHNVRLWIKSPRCVESLRLRNHLCFLVESGHIKRWILAPSFLSRHPFVGKRRKQRYTHTHTDRVWRWGQSSFNQIVFTMALYGRVDYWDERYDFSE